MLSEKRYIIEGIKLSFALMVGCCTTMLHSAAPAELQLTDIIQHLQLSTDYSLLRFVSNKDLATLARVNKKMHDLVEKELVSRQAQRAIYLSNVLNAQDLDFMNQRGHFASRDAFKKALLDRIDTFARTNPGRWIKLYLRENNLGEDNDFFVHLIHEIIDKVHGLGIDIVNLDLRNNHLTSLPANIFAGLSNLQTLWLHFNQLTTLPANIFAGLSNLQDLRINYPKDLT
jgi:hypothetical protein